MANFNDYLIFITGGSTISYTSSEVFYYDIKTNRWSCAPKMVKARFDHSSCILGNALYVYGGQHSEKGKILPIPMERLASINKGIGEASHCWEILQISTLDKLNCLMIPLNCSEKILILEENDEE